MVEKFRRLLLGKGKKGEGITLKHWVAYILFGAIILVFALFGINPDQYGQSSGGVAAVVNDSSISLQEYRSRVENIEQNARLQFDQFPEAQRRQLSQELRRRALEELIIGEVIYQDANRRGLMASDAEVRDYLLQIPFLQDKGRFQRDRYAAFLQNMNMSTESFERQIRKQLVTQKLQELFVGSSAPSREEMQRNQMLANQKVSVRFAQISRQDLAKTATLPDKDVQAYASQNKDKIEKYYSDNKTEFSHPERVKARHILVRFSDKRNESEALKLIQDIRKEANAKNFAQLATKHSDDPGSKTKGGDLGEFQRGRMVPEFEEATFKLNPGQISEPVKTPFGYHIILVEAKFPAKTDSLEAVRTDIARALIGREKEGEIVGKIRQVVESGNKSAVEGVLSKAGVKWQESGEVDLTTTNVPKLGENPNLLASILKKGKGGGLLPQLIDADGNYLVVDVASWKEVSAKNPEVEGVQRMLAYRKSSDVIENWSKEVQTKASIQRNPRLVQQ